MNKTLLIKSNGVMKMSDALKLIRDEMEKQKKTLNEKLNSSV